jgi:multidrug efflux system membrane fusion protein
VIRSVILAILIAVGALGWILSGQFSGPPADETAAINSENPDGATDPDVAPALQPEKHGPQQVKVRTYTAIPRDQHIVVRGRTEALRIVEIKAEIPGRVASIEAEKGDRVKKGDVLVRFAIKDMNAKLKEAEALVRQREIEYNAAKSLSKKRFQRENDTGGNKSAVR